MPQKAKFTGSDYLLLLLYLNKQRPIRSSVRLIKMMFIFNKEIAPLLRKKGATISEEDLPNFWAYNYGPFSKDIYEQIELFKNIGFIKVRNLNVREEMSEVDDWEEKPFIDELESQESYDNRRDGKFMEYELLPLGVKYVECEIKSNFAADQLEILSNFKKKIVETPIKTILRYVYIKYPDMTKNSLIKDEVLRN